MNDRLVSFACRVAFTVEVVFWGFMLSREGEDSSRAACFASSVNDSLTGFCFLCPLIFVY